jgi:hypothetical protein
MIRFHTAFALATLAVAAAACGHDKPANDPSAMGSESSDPSKADADPYRTNGINGGKGLGTEGSDPAPAPTGDVKTGAETTGSNQRGTTPDGAGR